MHEAKTDWTTRRKIKCIILGGDLSSPVPATGNSGRQSITEDITEFSTTMKQLYLTNIVRILHPTIADDAFSQNSRGTCTKIDQILDIKQTFKNEKDINYAKNVLRPTGN